MLVNVIKNNYYLTKNTVILFTVILLYETTPCPTTFFVSDGASTMLKIGWPLNIIYKEVKLKAQYSNLGTSLNQKDDNFTLKNQGIL